MVKKPCQQGMQCVFTKISLYNSGSAPCRHVCTNNDDTLHSFTLKKLKYMTLSKKMFVMNASREEANWIWLGFYVDNWAAHLSDLKRLQNFTWTMHVGWWHPSQNWHLDKQKIILLDNPMLFSIAQHITSLTLASFTYMATQCSAQRDSSNPALKLPWL